MSDIAAAGSWVGRSREDEDEVCGGAVRRLAAMLDQDPARYVQGSELPESWYAILFGPVARQSALAPDGHPVTGTFLPPLQNTRRMFGGRRVRFRDEALRACRHIKERPDHHVCIHRSNLTPSS